MESYFSAVRKMEQTVMFPSLLQGVSFEDREGGFGADADDTKDLYEYYTQMKSIKQMVEGSLISLDGRQPSLSTRGKESKAEEDADLEGLFYYHISALKGVLHQLARRANTVTSRYNEIMQQINQNDLSFRW
ncbi:mid1-interacting protein 1A [Pogona vitticeps]